MSREINANTVALLIVLGAIWGGAFTLIKVLVHDLSPLEMAAGRLAFGSIAVFAFLRVTGTFQWPDRDLLLSIAALAMLDTVLPYMLVGWAESHIESGAAAVLMSSMPLFTVLCAALMLREEAVGPARLAGIAIGFAGVMFLVGSPVAVRDSSALGQVAVLGAAASYATGAIFVRRLLRRIDAANLTAAKLSIGAALAAVATGATGGGSGFLTLGSSETAALAVLGVVCTGCSFVLYFRIVGRAGSVGASTVTYIIPAFALLFGAMFLGEPIEPHTLAGMALIVAGVAGVMYGQSLGFVVAGAWQRGRAWAGP